MPFGSCLSTLGVDLGFQAFLKGKDQSSSPIWAEVVLFLTWAVFCICFSRHHWHEDDISMYLTMQWHCCFLPLMSFCSFKSNLVCCKCTGRALWDTLQEQRGLLDWCCSYTVWQRRSEYPPLGAVWFTPVQRGATSPFLWAELSKESLNDQSISNYAQRWFSDSSSQSLNLWELLICASQQKGE